MASEWIPEGRGAGEDWKSAEAVESETGERQEIWNGTKALPPAIKRRLEVLQRLKSYEGSERYDEEQRKAAQELELDRRSLYRLIHQYREQGVEGLRRKERADLGKSKIDEDWQSFINQSYRRGNRGMRQTNPSQVAKLVEERARELGKTDYPSRRTVYRILEPEIEKREKKQTSRAIGWQGELLKITTREGIELDIEYSNQVWQCDHTPADILVVDREGEILGRPTLTTVVDTYSRCIMGIHLGMEYPSAAVTCLALRHAIQPKQYGSLYGLSNLWGTYGLPQYLYTDGGKDFTSQHVEQVAASLGIVLCLRRRPSDGGIVERPFGTINSEFLSTLPGYTTRRLKPHRSQVEAEACLTLEELERLLVRYIVDNYNQKPDARLGDRNRIERWEAGRMAQPKLLEERDLDILLMRQERRRVYQGGYLRFANLTYKGEYLAGYVGDTVVLRYDPRDITSLLVYRQRGAKDVFLTRAHAQHLETERLSLSEAKAIGRRMRQACRGVTNQSVLEELQARTQFVNELLQEKAAVGGSRGKSTDSNAVPASNEEEKELDELVKNEPLPEIRVYDYEKLRQEHGI
jgi:putative transposase